MVGAFQEPSCGRRMKPIHSIPYSVAYALGEGHQKLLLYNTRRMMGVRDNLKAAHSPLLSDNGKFDADDLDIVKTDQAAEFVKGHILC